MIKLKHFRSELSYFNFTFLLLASTVILIVYKILCLNSTNKFFDDHKVDMFLDQSRNMTFDFNKEFYQLCQTDNQFCVPAFRDLNEAFVRKIVTVPEYKMAACIIPKCASTITTKTFAYLFDKESYLNFEWNNTIGLSSAYHKNDYESFGTFKHNLQISDQEITDNWRLFVSIRDPVDRIVSAFVDKCLNERNQKQSVTLTKRILYGEDELCYPCGSDFNCFLREVYKLISNYASGKTKFANYLLQHVAPQSWYCNFKSNLNDYTVFKYTSDDKGKARFRSTMKMLLEERRVQQEQSTYVLDEIIGIPKTKRSRKKPMKGSALYFKKMAALTKDELLKNETNFKLFMAIYYNDFKTFNYTIPAFT